jgi:hypothetical protein
VVYVILGRDLVDQADLDLAEKPIATIEEVTSQAPKKKYLSPSTRKRNAQRINQWKAKGNEAVGDTKVNSQTQTENSNSHILGGDLLVMGRLDRMPPRKTQICLQILSCYIIYLA